MNPEIIEATRDGKPIKKLRCPDCGIFGQIDDDQFHGRVSVLCECGFHETIDFSKKIGEE